MKSSHRIPFLIPFFLLFLPSALSAQQPCSISDRSIAGEARVSGEAESVQKLWDMLQTAYEQDDKKQTEEIVQRMTGYASHKKPTFSEEDQKKMEELAQRPEVKLIIEALYNERRAEEIERAHGSNISPCLYYPNPLLQDYVNKLGQSLVPKGSGQFYAFRIVNDPRPDAWSLSIGSVYVTTGLVAMMDNEAQLSFVLAHEIGHVEHRHLYEQTRGEVLEQLLDVEKVKSNRRKGMILSAIAGGVGAAVGARGGGAGALGGAIAAGGTTYYIATIIESLHRPKFTNWNDAQESDADEFAAKDVLEHNFDVREAPKVFVTLNDTMHRDDRVGMGFHYGLAGMLTERRQHVQNLLTGALKIDLELKQNKDVLVGNTNRDFGLLMAALRRDNGRMAFEYDLFDEARQNLEDSLSIRSNDPTAHLYLGAVYKLTAKNPDEERKAMQEFEQAIQLDQGRNAYALPHLEKALALLKSGDPSNYSEIQTEIKKYIDLYTDEQMGTPPMNLLILYDYLSLTGDDKWTIPHVLHVSQWPQGVSQVSPPTPPQPEAAPETRPAKKPIAPRKPQSPN